MSPLADFIYGAIFFGFSTAGLFFFKFWRRTKDRLFLMFGAAFLILAFERVVLMVSWKYSSAHQPVVYLLRLAAFILILVAIADKNRKERR